MGNLFNPSNDGFECDRNDQIYVDKTELLAFLNSRLRSTGRCIAVRPCKKIW